MIIRFLFSGAAVIALSLSEHVPQLPSLFLGAIGGALIGWLAYRPYKGGAET